MRLFHVLVLLRIKLTNVLKMSADEVVTKTLVLQVFDWDLITGDDDIGEVSIQYLDLF